MIRHIVTWKFREGTEEKANEFLTKLAALDGVIPQLKKSEVARNIGKDNYDAVLVSEFETMDDLNAYKVEAKRSRMSLNKFVYVAGLERGVRPMGLWSMQMTLSRNSSPSIALQRPGWTFMRFKSAPSFL